MSKAKTVQVLLTTLILLSPAPALASPAQGAGTPEDPIRLAVGQTVPGKIPYVDPYRTGAVLELAAPATGWLTIEARSLEFDPFLRISRIDHKGDLTLLSMNDDGGEGTNARAFIEAALGERYRIEIQAEQFPYCGGQFEISVAPGKPQPLYADPDRDGAYHKAVAAMAEKKDTPECRIRAQLMRSGEAEWMLGSAFADPTPEAAEKALALAEEHLAPDHPALIASLERVAGGRLVSRDMEGAKALLQRALEAAEGRFGAEHYVTARTRYFLEVTRVWANERDPEDPLGAINDAVALQRAVLGGDHPETVLLPGGLRWLLTAVVGAGTDYENEILRHAEEILKRTYGPDHPDYAFAVWGLGVNTFFTEDKLDGLPIIERAVRILERAYGKDSSTLVFSMTSLGNAYRFVGDPDLAAPVYERTLEMMERQHGPEDPRLIVPLSTVSGVYWNKGEQEKAISLFERALSISKRSLGGVHPILRNDLLWYYRATGNHEAAAQIERAIPEIVKHVEKEQGPDSWDLLKYLQHLAGYHIRNGDYDAAEETLKRLQRIAEVHTGPDSLLSRSILEDYAELALLRGRHAEAIQHLEKALELHDEAHGTLRPPPIGQLMNLARARAAVGEPAAALDAALRAEGIGREYLRSLTEGASERQALAHASSRGSGLDLALSLLGTPGLDAAEAGARAWDAVIRSRAVILDEMAARRHTVARAGRLTQLAEAFAAATRRCANLMAKQTGPDELEKHLKLVKKVCQARDRAEEALADTSSGFREKKVREALGWADVAGALAPDSALIAFALYDRQDLASGRPPGFPRSGDSPAEGAPTESRADGAGGAAPANDPIPSYMAFVKGPGAAKPLVVPIGSAEEIDALVSAWQEAARRGASRQGERTPASEEDYRRAGDALRLKVWDPLASHVDDARRIFVVADGAINLVNLAALPVGEGRYLLEEGPSIHYVSAERDLVQATRRDSGGRALLAVGGPDFESKGMFAALAPAKPASTEAGAGVDVARSTTTQGDASSDAATAEPVAAAGAASEATRTRVVSLGTFRGERSACGAFSALDFEPLPAAGREVEEIVTLWEQTSGTRSSEGAGVLRLSGGAASETAFKEQAPGHRVLHLATHGFFLGGECESALERRRGFGAVVTAGDDSPPSVKGENPFVLSGLALAGANHREHAGEDEDDGILTAQEIAAMDLSGVEWAVLSACDTGVGEIQAGEGVLGLRRAFQVAGAGTLIMSLWSVEDEAARRWMKALYEGRLRWSLDTAEAVRQASLKVLRERREKKESTHPFYWAGFVAAGDWR